jgi:hypothetical protein
LSCEEISVDQFSNFFTDKVERIPTAAVDVLPPDFSDMASDVHFDTFNAISVDDVIISIRRLPNKTSTADPISTPVLKSVSDLLRAIHHRIDQSLIVVWSSASMF